MYPPVIKVEWTSSFEIAEALAALSGFGNRYKRFDTENKFGGYGEPGGVRVTHIYHVSRLPNAFDDGETPDIRIEALSDDRYVINYMSRVAGAARILIEDPRGVLNQCRNGQKPLPAVA